MEIERNQTSVYSLHYHLILVTKYRRSVINDQISDSLRVIFERIAASYSITVEEWNHDKDHIHVLFKTQPKTLLPKFLNSYKSASSRLIKKDYPEIRKYLWKEYFWSRSFFLATTGGVTIEILKKYISGQEVKND